MSRAGKTLALMVISTMVSVLPSAAFNLYVLPEPFADEGSVLMFGDGDPVATSVDEWRSAHSLALDPYQDLPSVRTLFREADEAFEETRTLEGTSLAQASTTEQNGGTLAKPAFDNSRPAAASLAVTAVPEPPALNFILLASVLAVLRRARRGPGV
jgi:hypothetical protein